MYVREFPILCGAGASSHGSMAHVFSHPLSHHASGMRPGELLGDILSGSMDLAEAYV